MMPPNHSSFGPARTPVFDDNTVWAFRELAERVHAGRVLLATTERLLTYLWMRDHLEVVVGPGPRIELKAIDCPINGRIPPEEAALNGLAFLIPEDWPDARVTVAGRAAPLAFRRTPALDQPGFHVLYRPWEALEWPDDNLGRTKPRVAARSEIAKADYFAERVCRLGIRGERALSIRCGTGDWDAALRHAFAKVESIEAEQLGSDDRPEHLQALPYESFDAVFCHAGTYPALALKTLVTGAARWLRRGGVLYCCVEAGNPDKAEQLCRDAGLIDFQWAGESMILGSPVTDTIEPLNESYVGGQLKVWEFLAYRPETGLGLNLPVEFFIEHARLMRRVPLIAQAHLPLVTNADANAFPLAFVSEARRRAEAAGGNEFVASLARRITAWVTDEDEAARRLTGFVQSALFHPLLSQPFFQNGSAELDPATLLFLGVGRCGAAASVLVALLQGCGIDAGIWQTNGHVTVTAAVREQVVLLEADFFKHGQLLLDENGGLIGKDEFLRDPRSADRLVQTFSWNLNSLSRTRDLWGRQVIGYCLADGRVPLYSSLFGSVGPRFYPKVPSLEVERRPGRVALSWSDATPDDASPVEYGIVRRRVSRGWSYEREPDELGSVSASALPDPEFGWTTATSLALEIGDGSEWLAVVPRLIEHATAFCWPSNEVFVDG